MQDNNTALHGGSALHVSSGPESSNDKIVNFPTAQQNTTENKPVLVKGDISSVCDLMCDLAIKARFNELTHAVEIDGMPDGYSKANAANTVVPYLHDEAKKRMKASRQLIEDTLLLETDKNRFHPVKEMLLSTKWDGQDRFSTIRSILHIEENSLDWILIHTVFELLQSGEYRNVRKNLEEMGNRWGGSFVPKISDLKDTHDATAEEQYADAIDDAAAAVNIGTTADTDLAEAIARRNVESDKRSAEILKHYTK